MRHARMLQFTGGRHCLKVLVTFFRVAVTQPARLVSSSTTAAAHSGIRGQSQAPQHCVRGSCSIEALQRRFMRHVDAKPSTRSKRTFVVKSVSETPDDDSSVSASTKDVVLPSPIDRVEPAVHHADASIHDVPLSAYCMATSEWVDAILQPGNLEAMDRGHLSKTFQSITKILSIAFSPKSPAHQLPTLRRRSEVLRASLDPQLPDALAALIARTEHMAAMGVANDAPRLHSPIALKLVADVFQVAPPQLLHAVISREEVIDAIAALLRHCCTSKRCLRNKKHASMTFHSLVVLRERRVCTALVNKACYSLIGRVRTVEVSQYDLAAVEELCWLIAHFRKGSNQALPRPWRIAMRHIETMASMRTLPFGNAANIAESVADVGRAPEASVQRALLQSAVEAAAQPVKQPARPRAVSKFLSAIVRLKLNIPAAVSKSLFSQALRQARQCSLDITMSLLASLRALDIQLNAHEIKLRNQQILRYLEGATITETLRFLHDARQIEMPLGDRFVAAVTKSIAAGLNRGDAEPQTVNEAHEALATVMVRPCLTECACVHVRLVQRVSYGDHDEVP